MNTATQTAPAQSLRFCCEVRARLGVAGDSIVELFFSSDRRNTVVCPRFRRPVSPCPRFPRARAVWVSLHHSYRLRPNLTTVAPNAQIVRGV
jgi:hypothetical protein